LVPPGTLAERGLKELLFQLCYCVIFWLWQEIVFDVTYVHRVQYHMACRNRYLEGTDDGQMAPSGYPNFNSYMKNLLFFCYSGQMGGQMDGQIEILIRGWVALLVPSGLLVTLAALGLENLFSAVLRKVPPVHSRSMVVP
jgi:hypothetical protein